MLGHLLAFQTLSIALPCLHSEISKQHPWKFGTIENDREDANLWILFFKGSFLRLVVLYKFFYTHHLSVIQKNSVVCCYYCLPEASANMSTDNRRILIRCAHLIKQSYCGLILNQLETDYVNTKKINQEALLSLSNSTLPCLGRRMR